MKGEHWAGRLPTSSRSQIFDVPGLIPSLFMIHVQSTHAKDFEGS